MRSGVLRWDRSAQSALLTPPVSKSDAMRIAILRHVRGEAMVLMLEPLPDDVCAVLRALEALNSDATEISFDVGLGGGPFRFLLSLAAMTPGKRTEIKLAKALRKRPHGPLVAALKHTLGPHGLFLDIESDPLIVDTTKLQLPDQLKFSVEPSSSQYLTGLLLAGANAVARDQSHHVDIHLTGELASSRYADLTARYMREAGFTTKVEASCWSIEDFEHKNWNPIVPGDWSSAAYLAIWAWRSGGSVRIGPSDQPDAAIMEILGNAGLDFAFEGDCDLRVKGTLQDGLRADALNCPDLLPTLSAVALVAPKRSRFENVGILRHKESDRLQFIIDFVHAAGGKARSDGDALFIDPTDNRSGRIVIETKEDHRRAMSGALLAALGWDAIEFDDVDCVSKSFPGYWDEIAKYGAQLEAQR